MFKKHFLDILCNDITYFAEGALNKLQYYAL